MGRVSVPEESRAVWLALDAATAIMEGQPGGRAVPPPALAYCRFAVRMARDFGMRPIDIAEAVGVSRIRVHNWLEEWRDPRVSVPGGRLA